MAGKRYFKSEIWTQNKWFRELDPTTKLFWFYLIGTCDNVGVWEEDWELASFVMRVTLDSDSIIQKLESRVQRISPVKLWVTDFCDFQYGGLSEHTADKAGLSYVKLLKKHNLWKTLYKPLDSPLEDPKDKDKDKDKDKVLEKDKDNYQDKDKDNFDDVYLDEQQN